MSFYGIYSLVFIVETDMVTVACHQGRRFCYVWSIAVAEQGSERDKTAESCQP